MSNLIFFICTANICRSPMAAALFGAQLAKSSASEAWTVRSAGTWATENQPPSAHAAAVMARRGISLSAHRAHQVTQLDLEEAKVVIVMTRNHRDALISEFPLQRKKIHLMSELQDREYDIADPYGGFLEEYEIRAQELTKLIEVGYDRILQWAQGCSNE